MKIVTMQTRARGTVTVIRTIDDKKFVSGCEYLLDIVTCQLLTGAQEEGALPTVHLTGHTLFTLHWPQLIYLIVYAITFLNNLYG